MKKIFLISLVSIPWTIIGCNKNQSAKTIKNENIHSPKELSNDHLITCEGIGKLKFSMSFEQILSTFGKESVKSDTFIYNPSENFGTILDTLDRIFTTVNTQQGKIHVKWNPGKKAKKIESLSILFSDAPKFQFANGIKVGSTMEEFNKINDNGIYEFYGFGWQFGGLLSQKKSGKFFDEYPCLGEMTYFTPVKNTYEGFENLMGDNIFSSNVVKKHQLKEIILYQIEIVNNQ